MKKLDPRDPLVLDVHELPRRAGESKKFKFKVNLPNSLSNGPVVIEKEHQVELDLLLEAVVEGVLVTGNIYLEFDAECSRCLDPIHYEIDPYITELYLYEDKEMNEEEQDEVRQMQADLINLEPALIDAVVLEFPTRPLCKDDCLGLCAQCGIRLDENPEHKHEIIDPRWSKLSQLKKEM